jgi:hypothetical protein
MSTDAPREAMSVHEICAALSPMVHLADGYKRLLLLLNPDSTYDPNGMIPRAEAAIEALDTLANAHDTLVEAMRGIKEHPNAIFNVASVKFGEPTIADIAETALASLTDEEQADG